MTEPAAVPPVPARMPETSAAAEAFKKVEAEIRALKPEELAKINVDIPTVVSRALGTVPRAKELRAAIVVELPRLPIEKIDRLEQYAYAAWYAHLLHLPTSEGESEITKLNKEASPLRERLLKNAEMMADFGLMDTATVAEIRTGKGNLDKANDLVALAATHLAAWDRIEQKTPIEKSEVFRAAELGSQLIKALALKDAAQVQPKESAERRQQAFTLLVRAYDTLRRAVSYLRWSEGDADLIAPSLFDRRIGR